MIMRMTTASLEVIWRQNYKGFTIVCLSKASHKGRGFANALDTGLRWAVTSSPGYTLYHFSVVILQFVAATGTQSLLVCR